MARRTVTLILSAVLLCVLLVSCAVPVPQATQEPFLLRDAMAAMPVPISRRTPEEILNGEEPLQQRRAANSVIDSFYHYDHVRDFVTSRISWTVLDNVFTGHVEKAVEEGSGYCVYYLTVTDSLYGYLRAGDSTLVWLSYDNRLKVGSDYLILSSGRMVNDANLQYPCENRYYVELTDEALAVSSFFSGYTVERAEEMLKTELRDRPTRVPASDEPIRAETPEELAALTELALEVEILRVRFSEGRLWAVEAAVKKVRYGSLDTKEPITLWLILDEDGALAEGDRCLVLLRRAEYDALVQAAYLPGSELSAVIPASEKQAARRMLRLLGG